MTWNTRSKEDLERQAGIGQHAEDALSALEVVFANMERRELERFRAIDPLADNQISDKRFDPNTLTLINLKLRVIEETKRELKSLVRGGRDALEQLREITEGENNAKR